MPIDKTYALSIWLQLDHSGIIHPEGGHGKCARMFDRKCRRMRAPRRDFNPQIVVDDLDNHYYYSKKAKKTITKMFLEMLGISKKSGVEMIIWSLLHTHRTACKHLRHILVKIEEMLSSGVADRIHFVVLCFGSGFSSDEFWGRFDLHLISSVFYFKTEFDGGECVCRV